MSEFVDFTKFPSVEHLEVKVNGKKTPLSIGDKLRISETDTVIKTVVAIQVFEDNRIAYTLEWVEPDGDFKQEIVTLTELKMLNVNSLEKKTIGL